MEALILREYFNHEVKSLKKDYRDLNKKNDEDLIHDLRVDIKKIKFALNLIARYHPRLNFKKLYKPFKKIFKKAGEIRDADIKRELLQKYFGARKTTGLIKELRKNEENIHHQLRGKFSDLKSDVNKAKSKAEKKLNELPRISTADYADKLQIGIGTCFHENMKEEELHPSRKLLKEIVYASKLNKELDASLKSKHLYPQRLKQLEKQIGSWHDKVIFSDWLNGNESAFSMQSGNKKALEKLNHDIAMDKKKIHTVIGKLTRIYS
jgi:CHAD domain-containing protein